MGWDAWMDGERGIDKKGVGRERKCKRSLLLPSRWCYNLYTGVYIYIYKRRRGKFVVVVWKIKYKLFEVIDLMR